MKKTYEPETKSAIEQVIDVFNDYIRTSGPTQEELDAEYIRICQSYDPTSEEWTVDRYNRRWIMCTVCGRIKQDAQMSYYGGKGGANRGVCANCSRNGRS